jgi:hypothetical protein
MGDGGPAPRSQALGELDRLLGSGQLVQRMDALDGVSQRRGAVVPVPRPALDVQARGPALGSTLGTDRPSAPRAQLRGRSAGNMYDAVD